MQPASRRAKPHNKEWYLEMQRSCIDMLTPDISCKDSVHFSVTGFFSTAVVCYLCGSSMFLDSNMFVYCCHCCIRLVCWASGCIVSNVFVTYKFLIFCSILRFWFILIISSSVIKEVTICRVVLFRIRIVNLLNDVEFFVEIIHVRCSVWETFYWCWTVDGEAVKNERVFAGVSSFTADPVMALHFAILV